MESAHHRATKGIVRLCGAQKFNRRWRELGGFCQGGLSHGATDRAGPSRGGQRKWGLRIGREVEFEAIMSSASAKAINARGGRDRKLATCERQFAQRLRYARVGRGNASKCPDAYHDVELALLLFAAVPLRAIDHERGGQAGPIERIAR
jgi:hypothetical protein